MKLQSLILVGLLVLAPSCANQTEPFSINKFYPVGPGCDGAIFEKDSIAGNGYLDVAANNPQFFIGVLISGAQNVVQQPILVGGSQIENANRNRPLVNQQIVTYRLSKRVGGAPKPYITNISLPFTLEGDVFGPIQLISPELGQALFDGLSPSPGPAPSAVIDDYVDIQVDVEFKGEFSADKHPFTTGTLTFPIRAYRSLPVTCPNGYVKFPNNATTGSPDFCNYAGQSATQLIAPATPTCCPAVGTPGC
jgi:hypothetical protein